MKHRINAPRSHVSLVPHETTSTHPPMPVHVVETMTLPDAVPYDQGGYHVEHLKPNEIAELRSLIKLHSDKHPRPLALQALDMKLERMALDL